MKYSDAIKKLEAQKSEVMARIEQINATLQSWALEGGHDWLETSVLHDERNELYSKKEMIEQTICNLCDLQDEL